MAKGKNKGKAVKKGDLPDKICKSCGRPFSWRKKWEKVWDEVQYCSDRCRGSRGSSTSKQNSWPLRLPSTGGNAGLSKSRRDFFLAAPATFCSIAGVLTQGLQPAEAKEKQLRFTKKEIEESLDDPDWEEALPFSRSDFARLDQSDDAIFYSEPKFVEHIDESAIKALENFYATFLAETSQRMYGGKKNLDVLDLCSSWVSHLPATYNGRGSRVAGLGMNTQELQRNPQLTDYVVQDLNKNPILPYEDNSFDAVVCALSIDYLTRPLSVMKQVARVLRPGGSAAVVFSNRLFLTKAVGLWTGKTDLDHVLTVGSYFHYGAPGAFDPPRACDLSPPGGGGGDPLFAVTGQKKNGPPAPGT
uniref:Methyltransferase type 11 domain-containing protein n=1 Tax=Heterosigma akashiwo TaxID=2829 RepID=A0A7S3Y3P7_HETAK